MDVLHPTTRQPNGTHHHQTNTDPTNPPLNSTHEQEAHPIPPSPSIHTTQPHATHISLATLDNTQSQDDDQTNCGIDTINCISNAEGIENVDAVDYVNGEIEVHIIKSKVSEGKKSDECLSENGNSGPKKDDRSEVDQIIVGVKKGSVTCSSVMGTIHTPHTLDMPHKPLTNNTPHTINTPHTSKITSVPKTPHTNDMPHTHDAILTHRHVSTNESDIIHTPHTSNAPQKSTQQKNNTLNIPNTHNIQNCTPDGSIAPPQPSEPPDETRNEDQVSGPPSGKDEGYAWVVAVAVSVINVLVAGYVKGFGIIYTLVLDRYPEISGAAGGWIMGCLLGARGLLAPVMGAVAVVFGLRQCVVVGSVLMAAGLLAALPAQSVIHLALTMGAVVGAGMCLSETPGMLAVTEYFDGRRSLANGVRAAGNPLGGVVFPPLIVAFNTHFGFQGCLMLLAGVVLHTAVFGCLLRPFHQHRQFVQTRYWRRVGDASQRPRQPPTPPKKKTPLEFAMLKKPAYLMYLLMVACLTYAMPNALLYTPLHGKAIGLTDYQNSIVTAFTSFCDFVMRLLVGWIADAGLVRARTLMTGGLCLGGVACILTPLCGSMWQLTLCATLLPFTNATYWTLLPVFLADDFGGDAIATTWGFLRMTQGIFNFVMPSVVGLVLDLSGGLLVPYLLMGASMFLTAGVFCLQALVARLTQPKHHTDALV